MILKLPSLAATIAALASTTSATGINNSLRTVADSSNQEHHRSLQASAGCIAGGTDFFECCPAADPNDGICTMLWCVDLEDVTVRDNCNCAEVATACGQVEIFKDAVTGLENMCGAAKGCCTDGTSNPDWDTCMATKAANEEYVTPNFDNLIPGGPPKIPETPAAVTLPAVPMPISAGPSCPATLDKMEMLDDDTTLYYAIVPATSWDADDGILCARMEVEGEQWIGFAISNDGKMDGSQAIIGTPDDGMVQKYNLVTGFTREANLMEESKQTLMDTSLTQEGGMTTMTFTKKLVEMDEIPILEVGDNIFLYALGSDNTLGGYHKKRASFDKNFMDDISMMPPMPESTTTGATEAAPTTVAATGATGATTAAPEATSAAATTVMPLAPPASFGCLFGGKNFLDCCPSADPNDGVCTLLWCVDTDEVTVRDNCECGQVVTSCNQLSGFEAQVDGLGDMCTAVKGCCTVGETSNEDWNTCMETAKGDFTAPDLSTFIQGEMPDFDAIAAGPTTTGATATAGSTGATTAAGGTEATTVATTVPTEPAGTSGAVGVFAGSGVATSVIATMLLLA